jgi:hypothetical protein
MVGDLFHPLASAISFFPLSPKNPMALFLILNYLLVDYCNQYFIRPLITIHVFTSLKYKMPLYEKTLHLQQHVF